MSDLQEFLEFQFLIGRLDTGIEAEDYFDGEVVFQFLIGRLDTWIYVLQEGEIIPCFNSS